MLSRFLFLSSCDLHSQLDVACLFLPALYSSCQLFAAALTLFSLNLSACLCLNRLLSPPLTFSLHSIYHVKPRLFSSRRLVWACFLTDSHLSGRFPGHSGWYYTDPLWFCTLLSAFWFFFSCFHYELLSCMHFKPALEMFQGRTNTVNVLTDLNNWNKLLYPFCFSPSNLGTDFHYWRTVLGAQWHFGKANRQIGNRSLIWIPQRDWGHKFKRGTKGPVRYSGAHNTNWWRLCRPTKVSVLVCWEALL